MYETTFLLAAEILGSENGLHMIYSAGNSISSSAQVPFLQIGEAKYGKPILDRVIKLDTPLERAALCGLVSMEATIRSNLTVGPPVEVCLLDAGTLQPGRYLMFDEDSTYMADLRNRWNQLMHESFDKLQPLVFAPK
jgi:putative proteasome-type protease